MNTRSTFLKFIQRVSVIPIEVGVQATFNPLQLNTRIHAIGGMTSQIIIALPMTPESRMV